MNIFDVYIYIYILVYQLRSLILLLFLLLGFHRPADTYIVYVYYVCMYIYVKVSHLSYIIKYWNFQYNNNKYI